MILRLRLLLIVFVSIEKIYQNLLTMYPDNFVQNTPPRVVFSTLFSGFGYPDETLSLLFDIKLILQRLSNTSVNANATRSISIMGSDSLVFLDWGLQCFRKEKHKTHVCVVSFCYDEMPLASIKQPLFNITHNTFRNCRVRFYTAVLQQEVQHFLFSQNNDYSSNICVNWLRK